MQPAIMKRPSESFTFTVKADGAIIFTAGEDRNFVSDKFELEPSVSALARKLISSRDERPDIQAVGQALHKALLPSAIQEPFKSALSGATNPVIQLQLEIEDENIAVLPWEYSFDGNQFLGLNPRTPIVRSLRTDQRPQTMPVEGPVRILFLFPSPNDYPDLKPDLMAEKVRGWFSDLQDGVRPNLEIDILPYATLIALMRRLRTSEFHILHYLGFSEYDHAARKPQLVFEEENGRARKVSDIELSELLFREDRGRLEGRARALRLVTLLDIEKPAGMSQGYTPAFATNLIKSGIPAAIATQFSLPQSLAWHFSTHFYQEIFKAKQPIDIAASAGRIAIHDWQETQKSQGKAQGVSGAWGSPILSMQTSDGQIYRPATAKPIGGENDRIVESIYREIEDFQVDIRDRLTDLFLKRLEYLIAAAGVGLSVYWLSSRVLDLLFYSGVIVALTCLWLLRRLITQQVPQTLNTLWHRRLLRPLENEVLANQYRKFLTDFNALLNHPYYAWGPRLIGMAVVIFTLLRLDFQPIPDPWRLPLQGLAWVLILPIGYVLGTLLWHMLATIINIGRLSHKFDFDIRPTRPDHCGGLKPLGDLYFANAWIVVLAGLFFAAWLVILSLPDIQVRLPPGIVASIIQVLTNLSRGYQDWFTLYQILLIVMGVVATLAFFLPMWNTHKIMVRQGTRFRRMAESIAAEIRELERYIEIYGVTSGKDNKDFRQRLDLLEDHYQSYSQPPRWPFDTQVGYRLFGSLSSMAVSLAVSEILPEISQITA